MTCSSLTDLELFPSNTNVEFTNVFENQIDLARVESIALASILITAKPPPPPTLVSVELADPNEAELAASTIEWTDVQMGSAMHHHDDGAYKEWIYKYLPPDGTLTATLKFNPIDLPQYGVGNIVNQPSDLDDVVRMYEESWVPLFSTPGDVLATKHGGNEILNYKLKLDEIWTYSGQNLEISDSDVRLITCDNTLSDTDVDTVINGFEGHRQLCGWKNLPNPSITFPAEGWKAAGLSMWADSLELGMENEGFGFLCYDRVNLNPAIVDLVGVLSDGSRITMAKLTLLAYIVDSHFYNTGARIPQAILTTLPFPGDLAGLTRVLGSNWDPNALEPIMGINMANKNPVETELQGYLTREYGKIYLPNVQIESLVRAKKPTKMAARQLKTRMGYRPYGDRHIPKPLGVPTVTYDNLLQILCSELVVDRTAGSYSSQLLAVLPFDFTKLATGFYEIKVPVNELVWRKMSDVNIRSLTFGLFNARGQPHQALAGEDYVVTLQLRYL